MKKKQLIIVGSLLMFLFTVSFFLIAFYKYNNAEYVSDTLKQMNLRGRVKAVIPHKLEAFGENNLYVFNIVGETELFGMVSSLEGGRRTLADTKNKNYKDNAMVERTYEITTHVKESDKKNTPLKTVVNYSDFIKRVEDSFVEVNYKDKEKYSLVVYRNNKPIQKFKINQEGDTILKENYIYKGDTTKRCVINQLGVILTKDEQIISNGKVIKYSNWSDSTKYYFERQGNNGVGKRDGRITARATYDSQNNLIKMIEYSYSYEQQDSVLDISLYRQGVEYKKTIQNTKGEIFSDKNYRRDEYNNIIKEEYFLHKKVNRGFNDGLNKRTNRNIAVYSYVYDEKGNWIAQAIKTYDGEIIIRLRSIEYYSFFDFIEYLLTY